jgi:hypothetical protein|tara:strand:- start:625 stop:732 length:108 start_codon:yes stop_codon:yes gene_type:complete
MGCFLVKDLYLKEFASSLIIGKETLEVAVEENVKK